MDLATLGIGGLLYGSIGGLIIHRIALKWLFRNRKRAIKNFWNVGPEYLNEPTSEDIQLASQQALPELQNHGHAQHINNLQTQRTREYEQLDDTKTQTRLFYLEPATQRDDNVVGTLKRIDIGSSEPYTALSYHWSSTGPSRTVFVDGRPVEVIGNLYDALLEMRACGIMVTWVDALCIDQSNRTEVIQILHRMTLIYSRADTVFAWLGCADPWFAKLAEIFRLLTDFRNSVDFSTRVLTDSLVLNDLLYMWMGKSQNDFKQVANARLLVDKAPGLDRMRKKLNPALNDEERSVRLQQFQFLETLTKVADNPYWRRAWILQELTVADRVNIACGDHRLDFDILCSATQELRHLVDENIFPKLSANHQHIFNITFLRSKWQPREPINLLTALARSSGTSATYSHDKIYSLLGVCYDSSRFIASIDKCSCLERTDNDDCPCIRETLRKMTETSIKSTKSLDIICLQSSIKKHRVLLPSWAPDWLSIGDDKFNDRFIKYLTGRDDQVKINVRDNYWRGSGDSRCREPGFLSEGQVLKVRGLKIGSISKLSGAVKGLTIADALPSSDEGVPQGSSTKRSESIVRDLFRTLTIYKEREPIDDDEHLFKDLWSDRTSQRLQKTMPIAFQWLLRHRNFLIAGHTLEWWGQGKYSSLEFADSAQEKVYRFMYHFLLSDSRDEGTTPKSHSMFNQRIDELGDAVSRALMDGRRLMSGEFEANLPTIKKKKQKRKVLIGWAHPEAWLHDQLFLLEGCTVPVILRPNKDASQYQPAFQVIGDAHVEKCMYGQLWPSQGEGLSDVYLI